MLRVRWCSYSRLKALPIGEEAMDPLHTRYPVIAVNILFCLPRRVWLLHLPKPVGSSCVSPYTIGTKLPVVIVMVPPDWKVSFSGMGSMSSEGELKLVLMSG